MDVNNYINKFIDYLEREYTQVSGNGELLRNKDEDIVRSHRKL